MAKVYVTRRLHFNAAHRLHCNQLDEATNERIYGLCNNPNGHGHNYDLEVTVAGDPDPVTGMVIDLKDLKEIVTRKLIDKVDHKHLNHDVDFLSSIVPTAENLAIAFWQQLVDALKPNQLVELKLYETPRNIAVYRGE